MEGKIWIYFQILKIFFVEKNSIRHNLSLHNRFVRIPNEIAGKSSWWTIDLRAKQNRGRKKLLSNDNSTKKNPKSSFTSVRDFNQSFYSNLQNQSQSTNLNILHDMLKSSSSQTSNEGLMSLSFFSSNIFI
jgi:hypothetical protein